MAEIGTDVLIIGGGTGGCAAAMAATSLGLRVVMTEVADWIGGQLTSQIVPPDEHPWIESFGCTARYRRYRELVRTYYHDYLPLTTEARRNPRLNPGGGWVSRLCHEPRIGWQVLNAMLQEPLSLGLLDLRIRTVPIALDVEGDSVRSVTVRSLDSGQEVTIHAKFVLDATELGDLLPMAHAEYKLGSESKAETGEPSATETAQADNVQGLTWCYALALDEGSTRTIDRPEGYEAWRDYAPSNWPGKVFDFIIENPATGTKRELPLFGRTPEQNYTLFTYRQIVDPRHFTVPCHPVTVVNWPMNDYFVGSILDVAPEIAAHHLAESKQMGLSLLYWLQTEAPRHDGGTGYPGLYLRPDITGTEDGFAQAPYIRESRRIESQFTVTEQMVAAYTNPEMDRAPRLPKSVGVGSYRIDLHPSTSGARTLDTSTLPFEIPLGALVPVRLKNLLPACKNLGVTHVTNGCYRLHPVEWNIGEAAGLLAGFSIQQGVTPEQVLHSDAQFSEFEALMIDQGFELAWPTLRAL